MSFGTIRELITGQSSSGKSILLRHRLLECERAIFWDPLDTWTGRRFHSLEDLHRAAVRRPWWRFGFSPRSADLEDEAGGFCDVTRAIGRCHVFIDESDTFAPNTPGLDERIVDFILRSRHDRVSWTVVTQRPALLNKTFVAQANRATIFRMVDPSDVALLRKRFGDRVENAPILEEGQHLRIDA